MRNPFGILRVLIIIFYAFGTLEGVSVPNYLIFLHFRRPELDQKVKSLLVLTPAKLTEWLIKEGLVPQEQSEHGSKLKLGMYSDAKKFPNSGGYVWLSDDARNKYVSVFKGTYFQGPIVSGHVLIS